MKILINYKGKDIELSFTRKTARKMASEVAKLADKEDTIETAELMIKGALYAKQPEISENEANEVLEYILDNCKLVDSENGEKGLLTYLSDMVTECLPKGFTNKTEPMFKVIE